MSISRGQGPTPTIAGLARRLGVSGWALWRMVRPELERLAADESRFAGAQSLAVDEHVWHHANPSKRAPKELTGMVDLARDEAGRVRARLLDLVPGRSKKTYATTACACSSPPEDSQPDPHRIDEEPV